MKTTINIGTNKGSVIGAVFYKPFKEITWDEVWERVEHKYPDQPVEVQGWALISEEP